METLASFYAIFVMFFLISRLFIALIIYFIPLIVAFIRKHKNPVAIGIMNVVLGWTFFGWLAALLWALNSDTKNND